MLVPEFDFDIAGESSFQAQALELILTLDNVKRKNNKLRLYDVIAIALCSTSDLKGSQVVGLKELAKYLKNKATGALKEKIDSIWIPTKLETSPKYRAKLMDLRDYQNRTREVGGVQVYETRSLRVNSHEQVSFWLSTLMGYTPDGSDTSWYCSPEFAVVVLDLLAQTPTRIGHQEMLDNLSNGSKGDTKNYKTKSDTDKLIEDLRRENAELKSLLEQKDSAHKYEEVKFVRDLAAVKNKVDKDSKAWAKLLTFLTMSNLQLAKENLKLNTELDSIAKEKRSITDNYPAVQKFYEFIGGLCRKIENGGLDTEQYSIRDMVDKIIIPSGGTQFSLQDIDHQTEVINPVPKITTAERDVKSYEELYLVESEGVDSYLWSYKIGLSKLQDFIPKLFKALLGIMPDSSGAFIYSKDFAPLVAWIGRLCSPYSKDYCYHVNMDQYTYKYNKYTTHSPKLDNRYKYPQLKTVIDGLTGATAVPA